MKHIVHFAWGLGAVGVLGIGLLAICGHKPDRTPGELYPLPGWPGKLRSEQRRSEDLDARLAVALERKALKEGIAREVIARRLTLLEAADRFRELDEQMGEFSWDLFRRTNPGRSDEERYCRLVILMTKALLVQRPDESAKVTARLEAELQQWLEGTDPMARMPEPVD